jgi:hypothetical protein
MPVKLAVAHPRARIGLRKNQLAAHPFPRLELGSIRIAHSIKILARMDPIKLIPRLGKDSGSGSK